MPQGILPLFSDDATPINDLISFQKKDAMVYYFHGCLPVFSHAEDDEKSFRMFTSQLYVDGNCKQSEIVEAFGVTPISVKRAVKKYREGGPGAFFASRRPERKPRVLTEEVIEQAQEMLHQGLSRRDVAEALGLKPDTFYRAIRSGRLVEAAARKKKAPKKV